MSFNAKTSVFALAVLVSCLVSTAQAQVAVPRSPYLVRAFFSPILPRNTVLLVWSGAAVETDSVWMGYRVRRNIKGITAPDSLQLVGEYTSKMTVTSACLSTAQPCDPSQFVFYGKGLFFKGFHNNFVNGQYILNYPPGAPLANCDTCWVFVDQSNLDGFTSTYTVTSIDTVHITNSDFTESPVNPNEIVTVQPSVGPASNLEQVHVVPNPFRGSAEWDPVPGENRIHFTNLEAGSTLRIFTSNGELVRILTQNPGANPGGVTGDLEWDTKNADGRKVVSGIYIYQVESPAGRNVKGHFVIIR